MKAANNALLALFATRQHFEQCDCYTFTLQVGLTLRYTTAFFDVVFGGNTWLCARSVGGILIGEQGGGGGPRAHWTDTLEPGTWTETVMPRPNDVIGTLPWVQAVRSGLFDECAVRVDRAYVLAWPVQPVQSIVPIGLVNVFAGRMGEIDIGRSALTLNMEDPRGFLKIQTPRNFYSAQCRYSLFDAGCTLSQAAFAVTGVVTGASRNQSINTNITSKADAYFSLGEARFTSGLNNGLRQMIRRSTQAGGLIELITPMPFTVMNGDALTLYPGCDKTTATCTTKFANLVNFGGAPYIPVPETAV